MRGDVDIINSPPQMRRRPLKKDMRSNLFQARAVDETPTLRINYSHFGYPFSFSQAHLLPYAA
jgi:hypothetical protein